MKANVNHIGLGLLRQPHTVLFGPGQRRQLPTMIAGQARRLLVATDARMAATPVFGELMDGLAAAGVKTMVFDGVEPDLPRANALAMAGLAAQAPDAVLGIGGGSCLDAAKVASAVLTHGGDVRDYYGQFKVPGPCLPVFTVPTTGGTGAEVTCIAVVYDEEQRMKVGVASPYLEARAAVIDPELTLSCPPGLTAAAGADALSHLVEAYTARAKNPSADEIAAHVYVGKNVLADLYAAKGLALLNRSLERVVAAPDDLAARTEVMMAAYCAGMAINTTGTAGAHAIQSPIGALTHTPHGFGVAALLPYIMRYNLPACVADFAEMGRVFGLAPQHGEALDLARAAILRVEGMLRAIGAPTDLAALGLPPSQLEFVAEQALLATRLTANNPRALDKAGIMGLLRKGIEGDLTWWNLK